MGHSYVESYLKELIKISAAGVVISIGIFKFAVCERQITPFRTFGPVPVEYELSILSICIIDMQQKCRDVHISLSPKFKNTF